MIQRKSEIYKKTDQIQGSFSNECERKDTSRDAEKDIAFMTENCLNILQIILEYYEIFIKE